MAASREALPLLWRSLNNNLSIIQRISKRNDIQLCHRCITTSARRHGDVTSGVGHGGAKKAEKISMAMKAYLERAQEHAEFMNQEITEYEIGKRHLANIMGADPDNFSQEDIDSAVRYLFPSGIYDKKARPIMKHPKEIIPQKKAAQFDADGRPFHSMFYTGFPNFYKELHNLAVKFEELKRVESELKAKGMTPLMKLTLGGSVWMEKDALETRLSEDLSIGQYTQLLNLLERLAQNPWAHRHKDLIMSYRTMLPSQAKQEIPEAKISESGRHYQEAEGERKSARAKVTIWDQGSGDISINGKDLLTYFPNITDREQVMFPLQFCGVLGSVDVAAAVTSGGHSSQAGALRLALSRALQSLVDGGTTENMRLAGLLTRDPRVRERKKYGQEGARKKFTWKKR